MTGPVPLSFDVTDALPADATEGQRILISAWLLFPDNRALLDPRPVTMTLLAGGSYDKRYHHAVIPGHDGYSAAEHLAALGNIVLLTDHLGVGESSRLPQQKNATRQIVALANHAATQQFHDRLKKGDLHPNLPPLSNVLRIGGGHSMGGMQTIVQQAQYRSYDGVMIIGYTADGVHITGNGQKLRAADFLPKGDAPDYANPDRSTMHENFYWKDVPADVIAYDDGTSAATPTVIGFDSIRTGIVRGDAAQIDAPIYFCVGEQDVSPNPHAEPAYFPLCNDFTLHILPKSAHCQTFAGTRHQMWDRMHSWARSIKPGATI